MNIFFPPNQEFVFLNMLILGVFLGILYDVFTVKRKLFGKSFAVCFFDDTLYTIICGSLFLLVVFITNNGIIRWYEFFSCVLGFSVYKHTVSKAVMLIMNALISCIGKTLKAFMHAVIRLFKPLFIPIKFVADCFVVVLSPLFSYFRKITVLNFIKFKYIRMCRVGK